MAAFKTKTAQGLTPMVLPDSGGDRVVSIPVDWSTAGAATNDTIELCDLPAGTALDDYVIQTDDIDSNGTPTAAFSFGEMNAAKTDVTTAYVTGLTIGQTGGIARAVTGSTHRTSVAARTLGLKVTTGAATAALAAKTALVTLFLRA